jgi:uncharacterized membrane protein HdeD (DUF308 family)
MLSEVLALFVLPCVFLGVVVALTKMILEHRLRGRLVQTGASAELVSALHAASADSDRSSALKWGLVGLGVGVALVISPFVPAERQALSFGLAIVFGAGGLLVFYRLAPRRGVQPSGLVNDDPA